MQHTHTQYDCLPAHALLSHKEALQRMVFHTFAVDKHKHFSISPSGRIDYEMVLPPGRVIPADLSKAEAKKRARTLLKELADRLAKGYAPANQQEIQPTQFPSDFPNIFDTRYLKLESVTPVYSDNQLHPYKAKMVEFWEAKFQQRAPLGKTEDGKRIYASIEGASITFIFKKIIHRLTSTVVPITGSQTVPVRFPFNTTWETLLPAAFYRRKDSQLYAMMQTLEGAVPIGEGDVGEGVKENEKREEKQIPYCHDYEMMIHLIIEPDTISNNKIPNSEQTELGLFTSELKRIFQLNNIIVDIHQTTAEEVDMIEKWEGNDFVLTIKNILIDEFTNSKNDEYSTSSTGGLSLHGKSQNASFNTLSQYEDLNNLHIEGSCFVSYPKLKATIKIEDENGLFLIKEVSHFFMAMAYVAAHEIYHLIINRALRFEYFQSTGSKKYPFAKEDEKVFDYVNEKLEVVNKKYKPFYNDDYSHDYLSPNTDRMKEYSLNTAGPRNLYAFVSKVVNLGNIYVLADLFYLNEYIDFKAIWSEEILPLKESFSSVEGGNSDIFNQIEEEVFRPQTFVNKFISKRQGKGKYYLYKFKQPFIPATNAFFNAFRHD